MENERTCPVCSTIFVNKDIRVICCSHPCGAVHMHAKKRANEVEMAADPLSKLAVGRTDRHEKDSDGQWWYLYGSGRVRTRVFPSVCEFCKTWFIPTYRAKSQRALCCSKGCGLRLKKIRDPLWAAGEKAGRWKGGRRLSPRGYVLVWSRGHHSIGGKRVYVLEHRLVMEAHLGRNLLKTEQVHHKNGIRDDNRIENLELWAHQQPPGQRVTEQNHCPTCTCNQEH